MDIATPGIHAGIPMRKYLAMNAFGSGHLEWLAVSPLHYKHMVSQPHEESDSMALGTAVHMAVLEPELFETTYVLEPISAAGPDAKSPRATKAYKDAVAAVERGGARILKSDSMAQVRKMTEAVLSHPRAVAVLARAPEREMTLVWDRDGRLCRGRADMLGDKVVADLKTTRSLRYFSPFGITQLGYYRQCAWYSDGLRRLGREIEHSFIVAVESSPPYDVGVFAMDSSAMYCGQVECDHLMGILHECELADSWPGMFPDVAPGSVTDSVANSMMETEEVAS